MTLLYASTFADALGKLSHNEQKQVKITTVDLMIDPKGSGLSLERLNRAGDDKVWSARVSQGLRIIMRRDGDDTLLAYVGHHDDAYRWAERRKFIPHERSGAMQIVEVVETQEDGSSETWAQDTVRPSGADERVQPFWALTDDQLLDVGVPRDWLDPVRDLAEEQLDSLFERLPAEAAEALYDFATGGKLEDHALQQAEPGADPFAHPDAQRRFRVLDNIEELEAALDAPFEKWTIFLHPAQRALVEKKATGPTRVTGSAGTGKTIVALHRAVLQARENPASRVLLTTFSPRLAASLEQKLDLLTEADRGLRERISVKALDDAALDLTQEFQDQPVLASDTTIRNLIAAAQEKGGTTGLAPEFLFEEWNELVDAWRVTDLMAYTAIPRIGRRTRLGQQQRAAAWEVFEAVRGGLSERGEVSWAMIYSELTDWLSSGGEFPFDHVVVDEAQDLSVAQVRFLAEVSQVRPDAIYLAGDIGQRIFRLPFSWASLGLDIRGRSHSLKVNYRTSHQIRAMADRLLPSEITDMDGVEEGRRGTVSIFDGPLPEIFLFNEQSTEIEAIGGWLGTQIEGGILPREIGILVRSQHQIPRAKQAVEFVRSDAHENFEIAIETMHEAKGLEFKAVAIIACDEDVIPDPGRLSDVGDVADLEAVYETERHLLYVALTRARDCLLVTGQEPGSEFLDDLKT